MVMKNLIKNILKEETIHKDLFYNMIKNEGLIMVCRKVGGIDRLSKILGLKDYELVKKYFIRKEISTNNFGFPIEVGGYDFVFKVTNIEYDSKDDHMEISFEILEGKVTLIWSTNETYDLLGKDLFNNKDLFYEITMEVEDIVYEYFINYFRQIKYNLFSGISVRVKNMGRPYG